MGGRDGRNIFAEVRRRLEKVYGPRRWEGRRDPVDVLVATILSQNTSAANSSAGFRRLKQRFADWDAAADAPVSAIERCIRVSGLSRIKAPRIRAILRALRRERGHVGLEHLAGMDPQAAFEQLTRLKGVGPKTALCVLLFALGREVFPVDTHIYRIARRLGVLDGPVRPERAHEVLTPRIAPPDRYALHVLLIAHGRACCRARSPRCGACVLRSLCRLGRSGGG